MRLLFLGDIHGHFSVIHNHIDKFELKNAHIIQVGDFGVGFSSFKKDKRNLEMYHKKLVKNNIFLWVIRGNHDYKPYFDNDPFGFSNIKLVKDYTVLDLCGKKILCVGGAISVDRENRKSKYQKQGDFSKITGAESWWPDEVFNLEKETLLNLKGVDTVVTHTTPSYCPPDNTFGFGNFIDNIVKNNNDETLKSDLLFERHQASELFTLLKINNDIENAYYGHFHRSEYITMYGTKHRLLNINELWEEPY